MKMAADPEPETRTRTGNQEQQAPVIARAEQKVKGGDNVS